MKILLVDDSKTMRMIIKRTIKQANLGSHDILEAGHGREALDIIASDQPDLILSDWNMPIMNGIRLLETLKEQGSTIPFGFVTSEGTDQMIDQATENGAKFYLVKPFTPEGFREELISFIH